MRGSPGEGSGKPTLGFGVGGHPKPLAPKICEDLRFGFRVLDFVNVLQAGLDLRGTGDFPGFLTQLLSNCQCPTEGMCMRKKGRGLQWLGV